MASGKLTPIKDNDITESFYEMDGCNTIPLALFLKVSQTNQWPFSIGVMTNHSPMELFEKFMGVTSVTIMNDIDAVIEVDQVTRIVETAQLLYSTNS